VSESIGEELKGEGVTGYEGNGTVVRVDKLTAEMAGEDVREFWRGGETSLCFLVAMVPSASNKPPTIYAHHILYTYLKVGNRRRCQDIWPSPTPHVHSIRRRK